MSRTRILFGMKYKMRPGKCTTQTSEDSAICQGQYLFKFHRLDHNIKHFSSKECKHKTLLQEHQILQYKQQNQPKEHDSKRAAVAGSESAQQTHKWMMPKL